MQNIWLFQANPDDYDLEVEIQKGRVDDWELGQHRSHVSEGDTVIFWHSEGVDNKKKPGIYGFGKMGKKKGKDRVFIEYTERLETPILKDDLLADPVLCHLLVIRQYFGANPFSVTSNQWQALSTLVPVAV
jgi:EVE domain